jgi:hypothetical protein
MPMAVKSVHSAAIKGRPWGRSVCFSGKPRQPAGRMLASQAAGQRRRSWQPGGAGGRVLPGRMHGAKAERRLNARRSSKLSSRGRGRGHLYPLTFLQPHRHAVHS